MIKVLIVDDHQLVIDGIQSLLKDESNIECKVSANSGQEALKVIQKDKFDLILLDIGLPEMDGIQLCKLIKKINPKIKVIALTMMSERSMIKAMIESGAEGYLLKNVDHAELVMAITRVFNGKKHYSDEIAGILMAPDPSKDKESKPQFSLSRREKEILKLITEEYTTSEISKALFISINTVDTHRKNIMRKLGAKNSAGMVMKAIEFNLLSK